MVSSFTALPGNREAHVTNNQEVTQEIHFQNLDCILCFIWKFIASVGVTGNASEN